MIRVDSIKAFVKRFTTSLRRIIASDIDNEKTDYIRFTVTTKKNNELLRETHIEDDSYCPGIRVTVDIFLVHAKCPTITIRAKQIVSLLEGPEEYRDEFVVHRESSELFSITTGTYDKRIGVIEKNNKGETLKITIYTRNENCQIIAHNKGGGTICFITHNEQEIGYISASENITAIHYMYLREFPLMACCAEIMELEGM